MLRRRIWVGFSVIVAVLLSLGFQKLSSSSAPTFYKDIDLILQQHCQTCHRAGEIAPMPLVTYADARKYAAEMKKMTSARRMPPWFADPEIGKWANDPSLTHAQIATIAAWADAGAPAGNPQDAPPPRHWIEGWNIPQPDLVLQMPKQVTIPAKGNVPYTYEIVPTGFFLVKQKAAYEIRPTSRDHVHHAVVYIRPPNSKWLRNAPIGRPF